MPYNAQDNAGAVTGPVAPIKTQAQYDWLAQGPSVGSTNNYGPVGSFAPPPLPVAYRGDPPPNYAAPASAPAPVTGISEGFGGAPPSGNPNYSAPGNLGTANQTYSAGGASPLDIATAQARALENQGIGSLDSWLKAAREKAIIQSGDPALAGMAGFGLDPQAGVFAQQNYLSGNADLARVKRARDLAHQAIINRLAARGIIRSGDLGYLEGQSNIDFGNQEYDVRQGVLNKLSEFMQQYLDRKQGLKQSTLGAYQTAFQNAANNPVADLIQTTPTPVTSAPQDALSSLTASVLKRYGLRAR